MSMPAMAESDGSERVSISVAARAVLPIFAAGDPGRPLPRVAVDWDEVFRELRRNRIVGLADYYLARRPVDDEPPRSFRDAVHRAAALDALGMEVMYRQCLGVLGRLDDAGIDVIVAKGLAVANLIYPNPTLRPFGDLDLVARERSWGPIHRLLLQLGFVPEEDLAEPPPKLDPNISPYEWKYWHPQNRFLVEVHYEDLLNAGLTSRDVDGVWQRARSLRVRGTTVKVRGLEDQLIYLCAHAHYHGYTRLGWLSDLAFLIRDHGHEIDWTLVLASVRREEAFAPVYYSLVYLEEILEVPAPEPVLAALRPDRFRRWWHERYLPTEGVVSLQPMPRPDFSFYFFPLFKRLLPDLLVMGRRAEKLRVLARLVAPPAPWLRYYYHLKPTDAVAPQYLLHPFKLLYHFLAEIGTQLAGLTRRKDDRSKIQMANARGEG
jgi:hypothetical protein